MKKGILELLNRCVAPLQDFGNACIAATAVAIIGFLFTHGYHPQLGIVRQIMRGVILFTDACRYGEDQSDGCGIGIPYRWLLALLVAFVAYVAVRSRKK
jgi:hypothetical protein